MNAGCRINTYMLQKLLQYNFFYRSLWFRPFILCFCIQMGEQKQDQDPKRIEIDFACRFRFELFLPFLSFCRLYKSVDTISIVAASREETRASAPNREGGAR